MECGQRICNPHRESAGRAQPHRPAPFLACRIRLPRPSSTPMLAEGASFSTIQRRLRTTAPTIIRWKQRFLASGIDGLDTSHPGQPASVLTAKLRARILSATRKEPKDGSTHWSCRKLAAQLGISKDAVHRVWKEAGLKPHRLDRYMASDDPHFESKAADIIGLYLNPPQHAAVFCVDEKTAIQALDRLDPVLPLSPGRAERHGFEYYRHGTLSLYAALDTCNRPVHGKTAARHTSQDFVAFLNEVVALCPPRQQIHIILDNLSAHKTALVREFLRAESPCPLPLHAHLFLMAQSGRTLVRQSRARRHRSRRLHFRRRPGSQAPSLYQRLFGQCQANPMEVLRPRPPHPQ